MTVKPRQWFRVEAKADTPTVVDLYVYDFIGDWIDGYWDFGVTAKQFVDEIAKIPAAVETIRVHVNSPGGDVWSAIAIANALQQHKAKVEMSIEGLAASAATIITSAGDVRRIGDNAMMMVHRPVTGKYGTSEDLRNAADALDRVRDSIVTTYRWRSQLTEEQLVALMDATTWMGADEAVANGFADEIVSGLRAAASFDREAAASFLSGVPDKFRARIDALLRADEPPAPVAPVAADAAEVLRLCREAGVSDLAESLVTAKAPLADVTARIATAKQERETAQAREREIRALCTTAKLPQLADGYVRGAMSAADVKVHLTTITATVDKAEIDAGLPPEKQTGTKDSAGASLNPIDVHRQRNERALAAKGAVRS